MIFNMFKNNPNISWAFTCVGPKFHFEVGIIRWTNAMWAHLLPHYTHQVHIKYIIYIYNFFFPKSIYLHASYTYPRVCEFGKLYIIHTFGYM